jgi:hypothetical protein
MAEGSFAPHPDPDIEHPLHAISAQSGLLADDYRHLRCEQLGVFAAGRGPAKCPSR